MLQHYWQFTSGNIAYYKCSEVQKYERFNPQM